MADLLATHLRARILRGEFKPGDTLPPETDLMADLQVSRPTLREALRILETESLISVHRGARGGARVLKPDLSVAARYVGLVLQVENTTIVDVYQTRLVLEPACARLLAEAADPDSHRRAARLHRRTEVGRRGRRGRDSPTRRAGPNSAISSTR